LVFMDIAKIQIIDYQLVNCLCGHRKASFLAGLLVE
jgi:hypothetical protein